MPTDPVEVFLDELRSADAPRHDLVWRLRKTILEADPKITEEIKYGGILFSRGAPLCGLFSYDKHVSLEFGRGAELPDPHQVLEGEGKRRRHIKITGQPDLFGKNIKAYIALALAHLQATRATQRQTGKPAR